MPYDVTGYDSAGVLRVYVLEDSGTLTGDDLLTAFLADHPLPPIEGDSPTDAELDQVRQQVSKLLTGVLLSKQPELPDVPAPAPVDEPAPAVPPGA